MAGNIITVKLTKAQARAIVGIIEMDIATAGADMCQVFGAPAVSAASVGAKRINNALVSALREDRAGAAA